MPEKTTDIYTADEIAAWQKQWDDWAALDANTMPVENKHGVSDFKSPATPN